MNQEQYKIIFKDVDETINDIFTEFQGAIDLFKNDDRFVRMRLLIAFSFIEVICGIFNKFYNLYLGNEMLMKKWLKDYCFNENNKVYREHKYIQNLDENYFYKLRCSIVHAFALPEQEDTNVVILNGSETHPIIEKMDDVLKNGGFKSIFISTDSITMFFIEGAINFCKEIFIDENVASLDNFNALKRIREEFYRRGAKKIKLNETRSS